MRIAILCAVVAALPSTAMATLGAVVHVARAGETPETIAASYYGNRAHALFIREANHLTPSGRLHAGQPLRIPSAYKVKVKRGDTLERLARRFLDDGRRALFLGQWNGIKPGDVLREGAELTIPFHVVHRASAPESLASLAKLFYGDSRQGKLLAEYNFRQGQASVLAAGERLVIPVSFVHVRSVWLSARPAAGKAKHKEAPRTPVDEQQAEDDLAKKVAERLHQAEIAWREGSYEDVADVLTRLLVDYDPNEEQLIAIHRLLGFAYVALGHDDPALAEFREVLQRDPAATLDTASVSPKIRAVFERARAELAAP